MQPYADWCDEQLFSLAAHAKPFGESYDPVNILDLTLRQITCGWETEQITEILEPMVMSGTEPVGSMGDDTPLAAMSARPKLLHYYFKQLFAQVTNPPLDPLREELITSAETKIGPERNLLVPEPESCRQITLQRPILKNAELEKLREVDLFGHKADTIPILFKRADGEAGLDKAMQELFDKVDTAIAADQL